MSDGLAQILAEGVRVRGADIVFGFPGGGPNLEVVGAAVDATGSYSIGWVLTAIGVALAIPCILLARPPVHVSGRHREAGTAGSIANVS